MALKRDVRYPGRFTAATSGQPQGAFKNRTAPGALDGSYIEQDWANDWSAYFSSLLSAAGISPNGNVDAVGASQYFDAFAALMNRASGVAGATRNLRCSITAASATAQFTADQLTVQTSLIGNSYRLASFSKSINLATVGAGGMDVGTAPISGYVAIYAIYNPSTGTSALLAANAPTAAPEVYGGANMPAGYTASALLTALVTDASGLLLPAWVSGDYVGTTLTSVYTSSTPQTTLTLRSIAQAVPPNAKFADISTAMNSTAATTTLTSGIAGSSAAAGGIGLKINATTSAAIAGAGVQTQFSKTPLITPQTVYYSVTVGTGNLSFSISVNGYYIR